MVEAAKLAVDEAFEGGFRMGGDVRDVEVFVPRFLVKPVLDAVVVVDGECDIEEIDCA